LTNWLDECLLQNTSALLEIVYSYFLRFKLQKRRTPPQTSTIDNATGFPSSTFSASVKTGLRLDLGEGDGVIALFGIGVDSGVTFGAGVGASVGLGVDVGVGIGDGVGVGASVGVGFGVGVGSGVGLELVWALVWVQE
jgi:hypothetical protein